MRAALLLLGLIACGLALWCGWPTDGRAASIEFAIAQGGVRSSDASGAHALELQSTAEGRIPVGLLTASVPQDVPVIDAPQLRDCLRLDEPAAIQACLASSIDALDLEPQRLGRLLCGPSATEVARLQVVEHALWRWPPGDLLDNAAATLAACTDRSIHDTLLGALAKAADRDPQVLNALLDDLDEQRLFGATSSRLSIDLAADLARRHGDTRLRALLESGARGEFGGQQVDRALLRAAGLQSSARETLSFLASVASSNRLPQDYQRTDVGISIAMLLMQPGMLDGPQRKEAWQLLQDTLAHTELGGGCAIQVLRTGTRHAPPSGVGSLDWQTLWDSASDRLRRARVSTSY